MGVDLGADLGSDLGADLEDDSGNYLGGKIRTIFKPRLALFP